MSWDIDDAFWTVPASLCLRACNVDAELSESDASSGLLWGDSVDMDHLNVSKKFFFPPTFQAVSCTFPPELSKHFWRLE